MGIVIGDITKPLFPPMPVLLRHPLIPAGAVGLNPRSVLGKEWWDSTRKSAEVANNYCCYACSIHKSSTPQGWLEGHEAYTMDYHNKVVTYVSTYSLCNSCHSFVHSGYLYHKLLRTVNGIDSKEYHAIVMKSLGVLKSATPRLYPTVDQVLFARQGARFVTPGDLGMEILEQLNEMPMWLWAGVHLTSLVREILRQPTDEGTWKLRVGVNEYTYKDIPRQPAD